jgi:hypothetical protein
VGAEQQPVALARGERRHRRGLALAAVEGAENERPLRVRARLRLRQVAAVEQFLHLCAVNAGRSA